MLVLWDLAVVVASFLVSEHITLGQVGFFPGPPPTAEAGFPLYL